MHFDLTKSEKKLARQIIEKGIQQDYVNGIVNVKEIIDGWNKDSSDHREVYHALYKTLTSHDKNIARKYDHLTGSKYILIIMTQLAEGLISKEDLEGFPDDLKERIISVTEGLGE